MGKKNGIVVGLDIGTTKVCVIVAEKNNGSLDIIGVGQSTSIGLRKGMVINIEGTVSSIKNALEEAEMMAGCEIDTVYTGIAGGHIKGFNSHGIIALKGREVKTADVSRVIEAAKAVVIPPDREVIHVIPQEYLIDDQDGIRDPVGMSGMRLEAKVHIVTGAVTSAMNIVKCAKKTGLTVGDIVLQPLASAEACLNDDEKELGVALLDIGGGTADLAIYQNGTIKYTSVITLGGNHVTNDIAVGLRTPNAEAERIKKSHGCAMPTMVDRNETIDVPGVGTRKVTKVARRLLAEIIEARMEEILLHVQREIQVSGFKNNLPSGLVVTGGTSILEGLPELAEQILDVPTRRGIPQGIGGLTDVVNSPIYATGVGLVIFASRNGEEQLFKERDTHAFLKIVRRMKEWFFPN